jgi:hypothetical protein
MQGRGCRRAAADDDTASAHSASRLLTENAMTDTWKTIGITVLALGLAGAVTAEADVTGSYDGSVTPRKSIDTIAAALVLTQTDKAITGTLALPADLATFGGAYLLTGKATPKKVKANGTGPGGALVKLRLKIVGDVLQGKVKAKLKGVGKLKGKIMFTHNVSVGDGSACDGVYTANQTFFENQVLGQALTACTACHGPLLQAGSTRLHVDPTDPLGTARLIALLVDFNDPPASRILEKPLNILPHGGGMQIVPGSSEDQILSQWVDLVAAAGCL